jgi:hypothetical protein
VRRFGLGDWRTGELSCRAGGYWLDLYTPRVYVPEYVMHLNVSPHQRLIGIRELDSISNVTVA